MPYWFTSSSSSSRRPSSHRASSTYSSSSHRGSSSSYYKRRPRDGYISRLIYKLKHLIRELWHYARRNPIKVFAFVIMPLISGGVLAGIAKTLGIQLPAFLMGKNYNARSGYARGGGYYGSEGYGEEAGMGGSGLSGLANMAAGAAGGAGGLGSLMSIAKAFM